MHAARSADVGSVFTFVQPFQSCGRYSGRLLLSRAQLPAHAESSWDSAVLPLDCPFKSWCATRCERKKNEQVPRPRSRPAAAPLRVTSSQNQNGIFPAMHSLMNFSRLRQSPTETQHEAELEALLIARAPLRQALGRDRRREGRGDEEAERAIAVAFMTVLLTDSRRDYVGSHPSHRW